MIRSPKPPLVRLRGGFDFGVPSRTDALRFIERYEWLGHAGRALKTFAIWRGLDLYGVEMFAPFPVGIFKRFPRFIAKRSWMLARGATCYEAGPNAGSLLIGACLRQLKREGCPLVVAYSDPMAGEHGRIYRACNARFGGETSSSWKYYSIGGRWYSETSAWLTFGMAWRTAGIEATRVDETRRLRWFWCLDPSVDLPSTWIVSQKRTP